MLRGLKNLLFPTACPCCGTLDFAKETEECGLCPSCKEKYLNKDNAVVFLPEFAPECISVVCASFYGDGMKDAMRKFKFSDETYIGKCFGKMLYHVCKRENILSGIDLITFVPLSDEKLSERGYNQSEEIALELSKCARIPLKELLVRNVQGRAQSSLLTDERGNREGTFSVKENADIEGKNILLADDIITTGSTLNECAALLRRSGAAGVTGAAVTGGRKEFL